MARTERSKIRWNGKSSRSLKSWSMWASNRRASCEGTTSERTKRSVNGRQSSSSQSGRISSHRDKSVGAIRSWFVVDAVSHVGAILDKVNVALTNR